MSYRISLLVASLAIAATADAVMNFSGPVNLPTGTNPSGIAAADFDSDGDMDLAVTTDNPDKVSIFLNNGFGAFSGPTNYFTGAGTGADAIVASDLDGDGDTDLAFTLHNANQVSTLINSGFGAFAFGASASVGANPIDIVAANFGGNALPDLATTNRDANTVSIVTNNGGAFSVASVATQIEPRQLTTGDFDGDGDNDLFVTNHDSRSISFLANAGGAFALIQNYSVGAAVRPEGIASGDLDGDGDLDIAVATSDNAVSFLAVFRNVGGAVLTGPTNFVTGGQNSDSVVLGDFDFDSDLDAALTSQDSNNISLMASNGNAGFGGPTMLVAGTRPGWIIATDFDRDEDLDLAVANRDSNNVSLYTNTTPSPFVQPTAFQVGPGSVLSGGMAQLQFSDDLRLVMRPGAVLISTQAPLQLVVEGAAATTTAGTLRFSLESAASISSLTQRIALFNFTTNAWVELDTRTATTTESTSEVVVTASASSYINQSTGLVRARISWKAIGPVLVYPWIAAVDRALWSLTQ